MGIEKNYLPKELIPFAIDDGGNYFCFNTNGKIYFYALDAWEEELTDEENTQKAQKFLSESLSDFLNGLSKRRRGI